MRGMVLVGAMGVLLAVSTDAQERPRPQGNDGRGRGMTGRVHPRASGWYGGSGYGGYFRLDGGGRPYGIAAGGYGYGAYSQGYAYGNGGWDSEDGDWVMPEYYSLNPGRFQRSWRGYYILPPNFAEEEAQAEAEAKPKNEK
jgi:hypothetical protein